jgi:hypothetical protein
LLQTIAGDPRFHANWRFAVVESYSPLAPVWLLSAQVIGELLEAHEDAGAMKEFLDTIKADPDLRSLPENAEILDRLHQSRRYRNVHASMIEHLEGEAILEARHIWLERDDPEALLHFYFHEDDSENPWQLLEEESEAESLEGTGRFIEENGEDEAL